MNADTGLWSELIEMNRRVDALIERVQKSIEPSAPISREIPFFSSIEAKFDDLPNTFTDTIPAGSDAIAGNNIKRPIFQNGSSRVYVRELSFQSALLVPVDVNRTEGHSGFQGAPYSARVPNDRTTFPFYWRWNFMTSMTNRWYADKRVSANSAGRALAGNHLAFRQPLIIEPMETFTFECELLGGFWMNNAGGDTPSFQSIESTSAVVSMILSGYREGI